MLIELLGKFFYASQYAEFSPGLIFRKQLLFLLFSTHVYCFLVVLFLVLTVLLFVFVFLKYFILFHFVQFSRLFIITRFKMTQTFDRNNVCNLKRHAL